MASDDDPGQPARDRRGRQADRRQWQLLLAGGLVLAAVLAACGGLAVVRLG